MLESLYASLFMVAGGIVTVATFHGRKRQTAGELLGLSFIILGIAAAVNSFYVLSTLMFYAIAAIGLFCLIASVYLLFEKGPRAAALLAFPS